MFVQRRSRCTNMISFPLGSRARSGLRETWTVLFME